MTAVGKESSLMARKLYTPSSCLFIRVRDIQDQACKYIYVYIFPYSKYLAGSNAIRKEFSGWILMQSANDTRRTIRLS
jgi:hypothetical protein